VRDLLTTVILVGALQGGVLAAVLAARKNDRVANRILAAPSLVRRCREGRST
jgi:pimeloyl-ACP methyl ester carboxylesterase